MTLAELRQQIAANKHAEEHAFVADLLNRPALVDEQRARVVQDASELVAACRKDTRSQTLLDSFLQEFGLSNKEGVALMCLAEALLRIPDSQTADRLIAEKIDSGNWSDHTGKSDSLFVNFATWGMILTGKLVQLDEEITEQPGSWVQNLTSSLSEPVVRRAMLQAMRIMGGQYVLGRSIDEGIKRGRKHYSDGTRYSFDMLGEGARTGEDAERYYQAYRHAFERVGELNTEGDVIAGNGVSVKLSALHPQYHFAHRATVMSELLPKITELCKLAKKYNIGISIDAEEAERLEISLDIFESLCRHPELQQWDGLGFVMQAYQKRAPYVAQWLVGLAEETDRKLMVRLVKGAYWDAEIKHAQEQGFVDYPVFTRKVNTDVCYLACAEILLNAKGRLYPQFATHNAYTTVAIVEMARGLGNTEFEFQRLYGMGELLYKHLHSRYESLHLPLRIYAPIGQHEDLLPYLVRRLLENGANSSFVNRFLDDEMPIDELVVDLYQDAGAFEQLRHSRISVPADIFTIAGEQRRNALGIDLEEPAPTQALAAVIGEVMSRELTAHSLVNGEEKTNPLIEVVNPSNHQQIAGYCSEATGQDVEQALSAADQAFADWNGRTPQQRAEVLNNLADLLEENMQELIAIICREAGRTLGDGVSEVREAVDFCRYYALQAQRIQTGQLKGRGVFVCISPWNFPLAIFIGQVVAALAVGNTVIAKPAEQTPLVAYKAIKLLLQAGCPSGAVHLLLGGGAKLGGQLIPDQRVQGVVFTGSTGTAQHINRQLAERAGDTIPLIAETGGQNCMIVDSTALPEQVVDDVISSAFHSAGQRCSALRVLYLQDVVADKILTMLEGALKYVSVGDPQNLATEVGPVIDQRALDGLQQHIDKMASTGRPHLTVPVEQNQLDSGTFLAPRVFEIDSISELQHEVFGPVLHVIRYNADDLDRVIADINATGFGLTLGVHSRIAAFADYVYRKTRVGNTYINRNIIGAVVGVNPFGGRGLSGTGPKAGGPNYLYRFTNYLNVADGENHPSIHAAVSEKIAQPQVLPGPTGEDNRLQLASKGPIGLVIDKNDDMEAATAVAQLILACGNPVTISGDAAAAQQVKNAVSQSDMVEIADAQNLQEFAADNSFTALVIDKNHPKREVIRQALAQRAGAITPLIEFDRGVLQKSPLDAYISLFVSEKTKTDNLVARGGNTQLFNLQE